MKYLCTQLGTDGPKEKTFWRRVANTILSSLSSNPDYEKKMPLVSNWYIEFDEEGLPWREIGIDSNGISLIKGPDKRNYGFWLDTNMTYSDFEGIEISADEFESYWGSKPQL